MNRRKFVGLAAAVGVALAAGKAFGEDDHDYYDDMVRVDPELAMGYNFHLWNEPKDLRFITKPNQHTFRGGKRTHTFRLHLHKDGLCEARWDKVEFVWNKDNHGQHHILAEWKDQMITQGADPLRFDEHCTYGWHANWGGKYGYGDYITIDQHAWDYDPGVREEAKMILIEQAKDCQAELVRTGKLPFRREYRKKMKYSDLGADIKRRLREERDRA